MIHADFEEITLVAGPEQAGFRLDQFVASMIPGCSRNMACQWIKRGRVRVENAVKKPGYRVGPGDMISTPCRVASTDSAFAPEPLEIDILFLDAHIIVINKPPGMVVHPGAGHFTGTLAHALAFHFPEIQNIGPDPARPGIVHRLDMDTSGVIVAARTQAAWDSLHRQFKQRAVEKTYETFVWGNPDQDHGQILLPIYRHPKERKKMAAAPNPVQRARPAQTDWEVIQRYSAGVRLECRIKTGRTHQIRVHLSAIGHPVMGDPVYGCRQSKKADRQNPETGDVCKLACRQMLHARQIAFKHPQSQDTVRFTAPLPRDMILLENALATHAGA